MSSFQLIRPRSSNPNEDDPARPSFPPGESSLPTGKGRKRKAPAHVSQNACTHCKKARAKCDGIDGQTCSRCNSRGLAESCTYELHVKTAKEELVRKIKHLESTVESLQSELKERDAWIQTLREIFSPGARGTAILQQLQSNNSSYQEFATLLASAPSSSRHTSGPSSREVYSDDAMETDDDTQPARWTSVTQDENKIHHLMALYFAWVHPAHMFFSERHFIQSFKINDRTYCSSALVNAICAMGCNYCVDKNGANEPTIRRLGERFTERARSELRTEKTMTPLSIVTYAIIFLVELSAGHARDAFSHLRLAIDSLQDVGRNGWDEEAFSITFFGIHALNVNWAALTYQKPPEAIPSSSKVFEHVGLDRPDQSWLNYKHESDAGAEKIQTYAIEVAKQFAELSLIHLDTLTAWCGTSGKVSSELLLQLYKRYRAWQRRLPKAIRDHAPNSSSEDVLPFVLLLHINYAVGICQLFNPLLESRNLSSRMKAEISKLIVSTAKEGLRAYHSFAQRFSNRYQTPLQAFLLVHLTDIIIRQDRVNADRVIHFCLQQLGDALPSFPFIGALQAMFCETVLACRMELPKDVEILMGGRSWQSYSREDKLGCSERLTYAQPVDRLAGMIGDSLAETFERDWNQVMEEQGKKQAEGVMERNSSSESAASLSGRRLSDVRAMDINSIMNP